MRPQTRKERVSVDTVFNILLEILFFKAVRDVSLCTGLTHRRVCLSTGQEKSFRSHSFTYSSFFTFFNNSVTCFV